MMWIKFSNLCRKNDRMALAEKTINSLLSSEKVSLSIVGKYMYSPLLQDQRLHEHHHTKAPPNVVYAQLKYMWDTGAKEESLNFLRQFSSSLARDVMQETNAQTQRPSVSKSKMAEMSKLVARCYFKQGQWQSALKDDWGSVRFSLSFERCSLNQFFSEEYRGHFTLLLSGDTL
jgi:serine/threonine-protein kinase mTOR